MKRIILSTGFVLSCSLLLAQSTEQGKQELYYQKYVSAAKTFQSVLQQKPYDGEALYGLVYAYLHTDQLDKARKAVQQAASSFQNHPFYKVANGYILLSEGKKDSAGLYFNQALNETKENIEVTFKDGSCGVFELVLGCDGVHSAVRKNWFGNESEYSHFLGAYFSNTIATRLLIKQKSMQRPIKKYRNLF